MKPITFTHEGNTMTGKYTGVRHERPVPGFPFRYEMRCADDSTRISTIEKHVRVNFAGTLYLDRPLDSLEAGSPDYIELADLDDVGTLPTEHI